MTTLLSQFGFAEETTYGTPVTPARFLEVDSCSIELERGAVMSEGMRTGQRTQRSDRFMPYTIGASGSISMPVPTKGFGLLLKHMLGTAAIGTVSDSNYTQTFTIGSLLGDSLTMQAGKPFVGDGSATVEPFTWHGCKVVSWELSCEAEGYLQCSLDIDAEDQDDSTALASASYPSDYRIFTFDSAAITIGGDAVELTSISVTGNNTLDTGRRFLRGSSLKKEPIENGMREYGFSAEAEFTSMAQYDRFKSATASGQLAEIVATFTGPIAHGGTTLPQLVITLPAARFGQVSVPISGGETLKQSISGEALYDAADSVDACVITYRTTDSAA